MADRTHKTRIRTGLIATLALIWAAIVLAVLIWQTYAYRGIIAQLAEWQFGTFDRFFPVVTIATLTAILTLPFSIILFQRLRQQRKSRRTPQYSRSIGQATIMRNLLGGVTATAFVGALIVFGIGLSVGGIREKPIPVDLARSAERPADGAAKFRGTLLNDRLGYYRERFVVTGRDLWVAPIVGTAGAKTLQYFVQVNETDSGTPEQGNVSGVLRESALPGGLAQLYRNAGYQIDEPTYVLFESTASARWPFFSAAADLALLGLFFLVVLLFQRKHMRKLRKMNDRELD